MLKNMKIKAKLILSFVVITLLASLSGITSVFVTTQLNREYSYAIKNYGFAQGDVGKLLSCFGSINVSVHDVVGYIDVEQEETARELYNTQIQKMDTYFNNVDATIQKESTKETFALAKKAWENYRPLAEELMAAGDTTDTGKVAQVQKRIVEELDLYYNTIYNSLAEVMADKVESGNALEKELTLGANRSVLFVIIMIAVALIVSFGLGTRISLGIANPIHECAKRLRDLSNGDLQSPVPDYKRKDEVGVLADSTEEIVSGLNKIINDEQFLLGEMAKGNFDVHTTAGDRYIGDFAAILGAIREINTHLSGTILHINQSADEVSGSSAQVSSAAQSLSQGAEEQAGSIEQLAATINDISGQVSNNAEYAHTASEKAEHVGDEMVQSNEKMNRMMKAMGEISETSNEIGKIIKTIEDIAFQTNILALNAAVEAARAGAAGKGFAVVADEVRNLASKSAEASKNTAQLIEASMRAVENGTLIANETADSLAKAVSGAREVVEVVEKISAASASQSESVSQVTINVEQISSVVQTNSATAEESAAASQELSDQARTLKKLVNQFVLKASDQKLLKA